VLAFVLGASFRAASAIVAGSIPLPGRDLQQAFYARHQARRCTYTDRAGKLHRCHSLMEQRRLKVLDRAGVRFRREAFRVRYFWAGRWRWYVLDLAVLGPTGAVVRLEEIKPLALCNEPQNLAKWDAARTHCAGRLIEFRVVNERNLSIP
jgi:hypothetical protein